MEKVPSRSCVEGSSSDGNTLTPPISSPSVPRPRRLRPSMPQDPVARSATPITMATAATAAHSLFPRNLEQALTPAFFRDYVYYAAQERGVKLPWDIGAPQPALTTVPFLFQGRVLDVGCGMGHNALWLASLPAVRHVTALDFAEPAISHALTLQTTMPDPSASKVSFIQGDVFDLTFCVVDQFDTLLDSAVFHCIGDDATQKRYLATVTPHVKLGGTAVMLAYSDSNPPASAAPGPRRISRAHATRMWSAAGWRVEHIEETRFQSNMHSDDNNMAILMQATRVA